MVPRLDYRGAVEPVGRGCCTSGAFLTAFPLAALGFAFWLPCYSFKLINSYTEILTVKTHFGVVMVVVGVMLRRCGAVTRHQEWLSGTTLPHLS
jgi:hypothetical protein